MYNLTLTIWNMPDKGDQAKDKPAKKEPEQRTSKAPSQGLTAAPPDL